MSTKTLVFFCNWSTYPGLQLSRNPLATPSDEEKMMVSMCSGRISPELILEAFRRGAWGVMITACPQDKCEHDGNYKTAGRIFLLKTMLRQIGVDSNRLRLEWIDKGESAKLKSAVDSFVDEVENMGPIHIEGFAA
jgi:F420-non-reducing hydrogenase iron-sulfur subunit